MSLLSTIKSPDDLKRLRREQLPELAQAAPVEADLS